MFSKKDIRNNLLGSFEIALLMPRGFKRFSDSRAAAMNSFKLLFFFVPLVLAVKYFLAETQSVNTLLFYTPEILFTYVAFLGFVYLFAKQYERLEHFYKFITISNWFNVITIVLVMPVLVMLVIGAYPVEVFTSYAVFITLVGYFYTAYILTQVLRIPWELGGFVAICGMCLDQTTMDFVAHLQTYFLSA